MKYISKCGKRLRVREAKSLDNGVIEASYDLVYNDATPIGFYSAADNRVWLPCSLRAEEISGALASIRQACGLGEYHTFSPIERVVVREF